MDEQTQTSVTEPLPPVTITTGGTATVSGTGVQASLEETDGPNPAIDVRVLGALASIAGRPWCLKPEAMSVLVNGFNGGVMAAGDGFDDDEPKVQKRQAVGVIPLTGLITPHAPGGFLGQLLGLGGGLHSFKHALGEALQDEEVKHIVLDVDSPGGLVDQVPETAAFIRQAREQKPITAVASTQAASAAYWLAAQADELVVTPSGEVGSIGVYMMHMDKSEAAAKEGVKVTLTSAGKYKTEGNQWEPLSESAQKAQQSKVNRFYDQFVADVGKGRGETPEFVASRYGEGRTLLAHDAVEHGLADRVASIDQVVSEIVETLAGDRQAAARASREQAVLQAEIEFG